MATESVSSQVTGDFPLPSPPLGLPEYLGALYNNSLITGAFLVSGITTWAGYGNTSNPSWIPGGGAIISPPPSWTPIQYPTTLIQPNIPPSSIKIDFDIGTFIDREKFFAFFNMHCEKTLILYNKLEKMRSIVNKAAALQAITNFFSIRVSRVQGTTFINDSDFHLYLKKARSEEEKEQRLRFSPEELNKALNL